MEKKEYSVSEAVRLIGVESHVLRYWEDELGIEVRRNAQGHRMYKEENIRLFRQVKVLKEKGLQLKAIRLLIDSQGRLVSGESAQDTGFVEQLVGLAGMNGTSGEPEQPGRTADELGSVEERSDRTADGMGSAEDKKKHAEDAQEALCGEIVPVGEPEPMRQFERILRRLIEEVVSEQNGKLEEAIVGRVREELDDFCLQYEQILREAAVSLESESKGGGKLRRLLRRLFKSQ